jgi:serine/threonine-protein kinase
MAEPLAWEDSLGDVVSPGEILAGKYRVERLLGHGGMGVVVEAWHMHFEERVAIKFLLPQMGANVEALARFEREARAAYKIKCEHVARVIDVGTLPGGAPYMVMEFLEGTDLADVLAKQRQLPISVAVDYILQACEAVAEAHALGIVHRDLKPENLFLTRRPDGTACIKVLDFGLSKLPSNSSGSRERLLTASAQVMGTPQYMSPEQWLSARDAGTASDLWALGVLLYELVTGVQPFNREHMAQLCTLVLSGEPEPMTKYRPDTPPELEKIILKCLRKEPNDRFANIAELALRLHPYGDREGRSSARRIAGVMRSAGVSITDEVPPSSRAPSVADSVSEKAPDNVEQGGLGSTQVMDDPESFDSGVAAAREMIRAAEEARAIARASQVPQHGGTQRAIGPDGSGPLVAASLQDVQAHALPQPRRADTAQSWQHMLAPPAPPPQSRPRRAWLWISAAAVVIGVAAFVGLRWKRAGSSPDDPLAREEPAQASNPEDRSPPPASSAAASSPTATASASPAESAAPAPSSSAELSSDSHPDGREIRPSDPSGPMIGSKQPWKSKRRPKDIFNDR